MLGRIIENRRRLAEFAPTREKMFKSPEEAPGCYFKRFSRDGRVEVFIFVSIYVIFVCVCLVCFCFRWGKSIFGLPGHI